MNNQDRRPFAQVRHWTWKGRDGSSTPGIGIMRGQGSIVAHLSTAEARKFADRIHDLCDESEDQEPATTEGD